MTKTDATPFQTAVNGYLQAGWENLLPLPSMAKFPPPKGFTGRSAAVPTEDELAGWAEKGGNIAIRLPKGIIGIDVDNYSGKVGSETIRNLEKKTGVVFPETWTSSRHEDLEAGRTMLYRVPENADIIAGLKDVDVIKASHRYLTAPPSIHPNGSRYYWYSPGGQKVEGTMLFPEIDEITELPDALLKHFLKSAPVITTTTEDGDIVEGDTPDGEWNDNIGWLPGGLLCDCLKDKASYYTKGLNSPEGSRHDFAVKAVTSMLFTAQKGHRGIEPALEGFRSSFIAKIHRDRGSIEVALKEFDSMVNWASGMVAGKFAGCSEVKDPCLVRGKGMRSFTPGAKGGYKKPYKKY